MKIAQQNQAIAMRKAGKTYSEILKVIPVAKSTLSLWLRAVGLSTAQEQTLTTKKRKAGLRGSLARKNHRLAQITEFDAQGISDVGKITDRELWLLGVALYWAEGSKQRTETSVSSAVMFANSDVRMLKLFLRWLYAVKISEADILFELYVHSNRRAEVDSFKRWWAQHLGVPVARFDRVYFKTAKPLTNRKNIKDLYHGLIRIKVRTSTTLNRQINGWIKGIAAG